MRKYTRGEKKIEYDEKTEEQEEKK